MRVRFNSELSERPNIIDSSSFMLRITANVQVPYQLRVIRFFGDLIIQNHREKVFVPISDSCPERWGESR